MNPPATKFVILYAEDDMDDLQLVQECFEGHNDVIEIVHAENGQQALHALELLVAKSIQPCLVILDINMPVLNGRETLVQIKAQEAYKDIPIVLFTTSNSHTDKEFAAKWGADFLTKPLRIEEIENLAQEFAKRCKMEILKRA